MPEEGYPAFEEKTFHELRNKKQEQAKAMKEHLMRQIREESERAQALRDRDRQLEAEYSQGF